MKSFARNLTLAALLSGGAMLSAAPASAGVHLSIGLGAPSYYGYHYDRPCWYYREHYLPAPARCLGYYRSHWGSNVYVDGNFVFRDHDHWNKWHDRDEYRHWRGHDWNGHEDHDRGDRGHHR